MSVTCILQGYILCGIRYAKNYRIEKHDTQASKGLFSKFANPVLDVARKYYFYLI